MDNLKHSVVFDTNAYRNFVKNRNYDIDIIQRDIFKLKIKEKELNYHPMISIVVLSELLKHLESPYDPNYKVCKCAIAAAIDHCRGNEGNIKSIVSYSGIVLAEAKKYGLQCIDSQIWKDICDHVESVVLVSNKIEQNLSDEFIASKKIQDAVKINLENSSLNRENFYNSFVENLKLFDSEFNTNSGKGNAILFKGNNQKIRSRKYREMIEHQFFNKDIAASILSSVVEHRELITKEFVSYFSDKYSPIIILMKTLYRTFEGMGKKYDNFWKEDMNTFNDIIIAMGALYVQNSILVTKDKKIIDAYKDSGLGHQVMDFDEYVREMLS